MITLDVAKEIAQKCFPDYPFFSIVDIEDKWAFSYDTPIPGLPFICVDKENGSVSELCVPPIENLHIINNGELIYYAK